MLIERKLHEIGSDKTLLLVDDDEPFLRRLAKAMEKRGFVIGLLVIYVVKKPSGCWVIPFK